MAFGDLFHGLVVIGMALWGTVIGAIFGAYQQITSEEKTYFDRLSLLNICNSSAISSDPITFAFLDL